jgi:membrane protease YdiL (CAAX protease family)
MTDPREPDFLAPARPEERNPWRLVTWAAWSLTAYLVGGYLLSDTLGILAPKIHTVLAAHKSLSGPERLYQEVLFMVCATIGVTAGGLAILSFSRTLLQRPAWTFVSPVRRWSFWLMAAGASSGLIIFGATGLIALALSQPIRLIPLDTAYPVMERVIYVVALAPLILLISVVEEVVFRGVLLQVSGHLTRNRVALALLNGAVYALSRGDPAPAAVINSAVIGALWAWSVLELGGLEFAIGGRWLLIWLDLGLANTPTSSLNRPTSWTLDWENALVPALFAAVTLPMVWLIKRWRARRAARS